MKNRKAFELKGVMFLWNTIFSLGSGFCGFYVLRDMLFPLVGRLLNGEDALCDM
jgi:hypothetical protein